MIRNFSPFLGCFLLFASSFLAYWSDKILARAPRGLILTSYACAIVAVLLIAGFANVTLTTIHGMAGDNLLVYDYAKNYINGFGSRINPNLGFPGVMDNAYFPSFDFSYRAFLLLCSLFTNDAVVSYNLMYFAGVSAMMGATLASFRVLGVPAWLSILGAAVYVVSPYFIFRSLGHDFLSLYISVPMGATLAIMIGMMPPEESIKRFFRRPFVWVSVVLIATSGLYYAFFTCMFVALVGLCSAIGRQRIALLAPSLILPILILPLLLTTGYGVALIDVLRGKIIQPHRFPFEQLSFGLSLAEASHTFADLPPTKWVLDAYLAVLPQLYGANGLFEWPGVLLTIVILISPVVAFASGFSQLRQSLMIFISAACLSFGLIYADRGGLGYYFNLFVTPQIRATARIMPFLSFFALTIVLSIISLFADGKRGRLGLTASTILLGALLASATPNIGAFGKRAQTFAALPYFQEQYSSVKAMLSVKDRADVRAVLQLPHVDWPEAGPTLKFQAWVHGLSFIFDRPKSPTRWSYGSTITQDAFKEVADLVAKHQATGLADAASSLGFDAVLIEKSGYTELALAELRSAIRGDNSCVAYEDDSKVLYLLRKACG